MQKEMLGKTEKNFCFAVFRRRLPRIEKRGQEPEKKNGQQQVSSNSYV